MTSPLETTLLLTDQQGSVLHTVNVQADKPLAYTVYGHRPAESGMTCLLGFNGEPPDPVTGHYLLGRGYRAFNPVLMRFNSPDSLSPFGEGGLNGYAYCGGDPVNRVDPTGQTPSLLKSFLRGLRVMKKSPRRVIVRRAEIMVSTPLANNFVRPTAKQVEVLQARIAKDEANVATLNGWLENKYKKSGIIKKDEQSNRIIKNPNRRKQYKALDTATYRDNLLDSINDKNRKLGIFHDYNHITELPRYTDVEAIRKIQ